MHPHTSTAPGRPARAILPLPHGVVHWFDPSHSDTLEQRLYAMLLRNGEPTPLDAGALAAQLDVPVRDAAATLFALNRAGSIAMADAADTPSSWAARGLRALDDDLVMLARPGQSLMLSTADGFVIACIGWTAYEARVLAVRPAGRHPDRPPPASHRLRFGRFALQLMCSGALDTASPALLRLACRLLVSTGQPPSSSPSPSALETTGS